MSGWNGLDFFIFLIFVLNMLLGMSRGATKEIISTICLSVALIFTIKFTMPLAGFLNSSPLIVDVITSKFTQNFMASIGAQPLTAGMLNEVGYTIALLICFVGVFGICEATLAVTGAQEVFTFPYATWNRKVGGAMGATRGFVINVIFVSIITLHLAIPSLTQGSFFVNLLQSTAIQLDSLISHQDVDHYYEILKAKDLYNEEKILAPLTPPAQQKQGQ